MAKNTKVYTKVKTTLEPKNAQLLIGALEDANFTKQDIYILYIDLKNAFGSIDHVRLLAIIKDLRYPQDATSLIRNILLLYHNSLSKYFG